MYINKLQSIIAGISILLFSGEIKADNDKSLINYQVDFRSQHVWRGGLSSNMPCIEPSIWISQGKIDFGTWAAQSIDAEYSELDLYLNYSYKNFTISVYDYFCPTEIKNTEFLNYSNSTTKHSFDINFSYNGSQNFPISILISTIVYGDDKNPNNNKNYFSTYLELAYSTEIENNSLNFFLGFTPTGSYYSTKFGIVNTGVSSTSEIKTFNNYKIPVIASIIANPLKKNLFLVFGFNI